MTNNFLKRKSALVGPQASLMESERNAGYEV